MRLRALIANNLAFTLNQIGAPEEARVFGLVALNDKSKLEIISPGSIAITLRNLGESQLALHQYSEAEQSFAKADSIYRELGRYGDNYLTHASLLRIDQGMLAYRKAKPAVGARMARDALRTLLQSAGTTPGGDVVSAYALTTALHLLARDLPRTCDFARRGLDLSNALHYNNVGNVALLRGGQAKCLEDRAQKDAARREWAATKALVERGLPNGAHVQLFSRNEFMDLFTVR
jgi:tetratricopeptide (TPR) repeat protein